MHVAIDASLIQPGTQGGIEQAIYGTVAALARLDGSDHYTVLVHHDAAHWLDAVRGPQLTVVVHPPTAAAARGLLYRGLGPLGPAASGAYRALRGLGDPSYRMAPPDPSVAAVGADVVHFPMQWMSATNRPTLFSPHDVLHLRLPEVLRPDDLARRRALFPIWCAAATLIEVPSYAVKDDLCQLMNIPAEKVAVVLKGPATAFSTPGMAAGVESLRSYRLPQSFVLFPGQTWPHKNHVRLFEALALLRDRHRAVIPLVCTGRKNEHWPVLRDRLADLKLEEQVRFLDYLPAGHLAALYHHALFTVFPSLFEGAGLPLLEAFDAGSALACSDIPVLREQTGDAALLFDPLSVESIAAALLQLWRDASLRGVLRERGRLVTRRYSWGNAARRYRALYRRLAGAPLADDDQQALREAFEVPAVATSPLVGDQARAE